jgi:hypothetical protein
VRRHTDSRGRDWDVVLGRESFGALYALFLPARDNPGRPRQALLRAESQTEAETELDALSTTELNDLLEGSEPKSMQ